MPNPEVDNYVIPKKRPLVALLMADEFHDPIVGGEKAITIREGWRDYHAGEKVVLCRCADMGDMPEGVADYGWAYMAKLTHVRHCMLKEVSLADLNADGMATLDDAIAVLGRFYENISGESLVTVIKLELL